MGKVIMSGIVPQLVAPLVGLPSGYTELEYIQSTGTQYIDTEFKPNQDTRVVMDVQATSANTYAYFGGRNGSKNKSMTFFMMSATKVRSDYGATEIESTVSNPTNRVVIDVNKNSFNYGGVSGTHATSTFQSDYSMYLLAVHNGTSASYHMPAKLYSCQIYDNGTLVRDFVPCINPDGKIGLYDRVTKTFFGNSGTGIFISGAKIYGDGIVASDIAVGSSIYLNENGSLVEYLVVHQGLPSSIYDSSCDGTWLLRKDLYSEGPWISSASNNYKNSTIHTYLNGSFLNLFSDNVKAYINAVKIPYVNGNGGSSVVSGSSGLSASVFLLSGYELGWTQASGNFPIDGACLSYFSNTSKTDKKRIGYINGSAKQWWLRSPCTSDTINIWCVSASGGCVTGHYTYGYYYRPALILSSNAIFDEDTMTLKGVS